MKTAKPLRGVKRSGQRSLVDLVFQQIANFVPEAKLIFNLLKVMSIFIFYADSEESKAARRQS
jgi:hypothetical protein